jgi:tetratricopeptide (TPR) repeat protein
MWPGLFQLWRRAEVSGLSLAMLFAVLLNLAIASTLVWTELLPAGWRHALWGTLTILWLTTFVTSFRQTMRTAGPTTESEDLFSAANEEYLRGRLDLAWECLTQLMRRNPRDVEAGLLMATIDRRRGNYEQSKERLRKLQRLEAAAAWQNELDDEWRRVCRQQDSPGDEHDSPTLADETNSSWGRASSCSPQETQPVT